LKADLSIKLSKERVLTLSRTRQHPVDAGFTQQERAVGPFSKSWILPEYAHSKGISAKVATAVLTVTVPRKQPEPQVDDAQEFTISWAVLLCGPNFL
jgi:HSP20 family molecular chaperone IbpA